VDNNAPETINATGQEPNANIASKENAKLEVVSPSAAPITIAKELDKIALFVVKVNVLANAVGNAPTTNNAQAKIRIVEHAKVAFVYLENAKRPAWITTDVVPKHALVVMEACVRKDWDVQANVWD